MSYPAVPDNQDATAFPCPTNPATGGPYDRRITLMLLCDPLALTPAVQAPFEQVPCSYVVVVRSATSCGITNVTSSTSTPSNSPSATATATPSGTGSATATPSGSSSPTGTATVTPSASTVPYEWCLEDYECRYSVAAAGAEVHYDLSPMCTEGVPLVTTIGGTDATLAFQVCGTANASCVPTYRVPYNLGAAVQFLVSAPPGGDCIDAAGATVPCTPACEVLGIGIPTFSLLNASFPMDGIAVTYPAMPAFETDPYDCEIDPGTGGPRSRNFAVHVACDPSAEQPQVLPALETSPCSYVVPMRSKHGCGSGDSRSPTTSPSVSATASVSASASLSASASGSASASAWPSAAVSPSCRPDADADRDHCRCRHHDGDTSEEYPGGKDYCGDAERDLGGSCPWPPKPRPSCHPTIRSPSASPTGSVSVSSTPARSRQASPSCRPDAPSDRDRCRCRHPGGWDAGDEYPGGRDYCGDDERDRDGRCPWPPRPRPSCHPSALEEVGATPTPTPSVLQQPAAAAGSSFTVFMSLTAVGGLVVGAAAALVVAMVRRRRATPMAGKGDYRDDFSRTEGDDAHPMGNHGRGHRSHKPSQIAHAGTSLRTPAALLGDEGPVRVRSGSYEEEAAHTAAMRGGSTAARIAASSGVKVLNPMSLPLHSAKRPSQAM